MIRKGISIFGIVCILLIMAGCNQNTDTLESTKESEYETVENTESSVQTVYEKGRIYFDDALLTELEKNNGSSYYIVLVIENTGMDYETVNKKFINKYGLCVVYNSYSQNHIIHIKSDAIKKLKCPEDMSISLQLAYPVEYYEKDLHEVEDWKTAFKGDRIFVKIVLEAETHEEYESKLERIMEFMEKYDIGEDEREYFSYDIGKANEILYLILAKDTIEDMLKDDKVHSIYIQPYVPVQDF